MIRTQQRLLRGVMAPVLAAMPFLLFGCNNATQSTKSTSNLVILSPHAQEIQEEFERVWKTRQPDVPLRWQDYGGSTDDLKFVQNQFRARGDKKDQGIGIDIFFGGGMEAFAQLEDQGLLQPLPEDYGVPATLNGVPLRGENNTWVGAALSGFGILYNKTFAERDKLPVPKVWGDLGHPGLRNRIELADPRHSGSAHTAYEIILQTNGWDKGWQILTAMTGNARRYVQSSSQMLQDVKSGEAVMAPAIDFYARSEIATAEAGKLGYIEPQGQNVVTADPIGLLKGAPNAEKAREFVKFVLSPEGQKLWMLKKGAPGGPVENALYRQAALPSLYQSLGAGSLVQSNPYKAKNVRPYDSKKATRRRQILDDLIGSVLIDNHNLIKQRWTANPDAAGITFVPITEAEADTLSKQWDDPTFRQKKTVEWKQAARKHFG